MQLNYLLSIMILLCTAILARESDNDIDQLKIGNLALPGSQQPNTLFGFGQNIVDRYDLQGFLYPLIEIGPTMQTIEMAPSLLYGITDDLSLYLSWPIAARFQQDNKRSSGPEDFIIQGEYALITQKTVTSSDQITVVGALYAPFGNPFKNPPLSLRATSFFLGMTASHISTQWYWYLSPGALITTNYNNTSTYGNQYLYQAGFGSNITYAPDRWIVAWVVDLLGTYTKKNRIEGKNDPNTGGNTIALGFSLWFSTQECIIGAGVAPSIAQHLNGQQAAVSVSISGSLSWKFH